jgi:hypothetical protein
MGADATVKDWMRFKSEFKAWSVGFPTLFAEWLAAQPAGSKFGHSGGGEDEVCFVRDYIDSRLWRKVSFNLGLIQGSICKPRCLCDMYHGWQRRGEDVVLVQRRGRSCSHA